MLTWLETGGRRLSGWAPGANIPPPEPPIGTDPGSPGAVAARPEAAYRR
ncbi:MAG TPA: hypothetical protein VFT47_07875 [Vicinamibacterales bacterium]|nr:hypothetical protein [Vicinamibacterales bacterium]